jgi:DNA-binding phage protein
VARRPPAEAVGALHRRLARLAPRDPERARLVASTAELYGITRSTLYRALQGQLRPRAAQLTGVGIRRSWGLDVPDGLA